jgi:glycerol uptake facilitator-like aquaporin
MTHPAPWRRFLAEFLGTALLVTAVVGSGVMASRLSPHDTGVQLLENSIATAFALGALILIFGPVSGAHFNPVVSAADWFLGRRTRTGLTGRDLAGYVAAQTAGAIAGSILANLMFALPAVTWSTTRRSAGHLWVGEVVATAGLVLLIFALARSGRGRRLHRRGLLVHLVHLVRQPGRHYRAGVHRHLYRHHAGVRAGLPRRPGRRRRGRGGAARGALSGGGARCRPGRRPARGSQRRHRPTRHGHCSPPGRSVAMSIDRPCQAAVEGTDPACVGSG